MKTIPAALAAHLALPTTTLATCLIVIRTDGTILRATNLDQDLTVDGDLYYSISGGTATDVQSSSALNVDNSEHHGIYGVVTEADLLAGVWDFATYSRFIVNYADLTQGRYHQQDGKTGQFTTDRLSFTAELRGLMQALQQSFGRTYTPTCPWNLGDANCRKDLTSFTVSGTIGSVSPDNATMFDAARAEAGPAGGVSITAITNAKPCKITTASALGLPSGSSVILSGILGPTALNGTVTIRNVIGTHFEIDINTTDTAVYPAYTSGGIATPLGADSGYFDNGLFTATSGLCAGRSMEVKSYKPGQWTLQQPMPFAMAAGDTYTLIAGCDKQSEICRVKFSNLNNFGGFPLVPGQDSIVQVGRKQ